MWVYVSACVHPYFAQMYVPDSQSSQCRCQRKSHMAAVMKAVKAMKARKAGRAMIATGAFSSVAANTGTKSKDVKVVITNYMELATSELKRNGAFKIGGYLNLKGDKKPARTARKGVNRLTKEPCVLKAKRASKTIRALDTKKLKGQLDEEVVHDQQNEVGSFRGGEKLQCQDAPDPSEMFRRIQHAKRWERISHLERLEYDERYEMLRQDRMSGFCLSGRAPEPNTPRGKAPHRHEPPVQAETIYAANYRCD